MRVILTKKKKKRKKPKPISFTPSRRWPSEEFFFSAHSPPPVVVFTFFLDPAGLIWLHPLSANRPPHIHLLPQTAALRFPIYFFHFSHFPSVRNRDRPPLPSPGVSPFSGQENQSRCPLPSSKKDHPNQLPRWRVSSTHPTDSLQNGAQIPDRSAFFHRSAVHTWP